MMEEQLNGQDFIDAYVKWVRSNMKFSNIDGVVTLSTPFLDKHNDRIEIYVKPEGKKLLLTDDGYIISDIESSGCDLSGKRRKTILQTIAASSGVRIVGKSLVVEATKDTFAQKKHALIQAMLSISDMLMLSRGNVISIFLDDVVSFLAELDVRYTPSLQFIGKSGLSHNFDFVIPATKAMPERVIRTINDPTRQSAESALFAWSDVKDMRSPDASMIVFLNDGEKKIGSNVTNAFHEYGVHPIAWSARYQETSRLTA